MVDTTKRRLGWRLVSPAIAPFIVASAYLIATRSISHRFTETSDYAAIAASVLIGAVLVAFFPVRPLYRVFLLLGYVPVFAVLLFYYTLFFVGVVFHDGV